MMPESMLTAVELKFEQLAFQHLTRMVHFAAIWCKRLLAILFYEPSMFRIYKSYFRPPDLGDEHPSTNNH